MKMCWVTVESCVLSDMSWLKMMADSLKVSRDQRSFYFFNDRKSQRTCHRLLKGLPLMPHTGDGLLHRSTYFSFRLKKSI